MVAEKDRPESAWARGSDGAWHRIASTKSDEAVPDKALCGLKRRGEWSALAPSLEPGSQLCAECVTATEREAMG